MRSRAFGLFAGLFLVAASLAGCASLDPGPRATQQRAIDDVSVVELATGGSLNVTRGDSPSLTIIAGEKIIDRLTADVESGVLRLDMTGPSAGYAGEIRYELVIGTLTSISVLGSGDATVDLSGAAETVIVVKGSGTVVASGIDAERASLTVDGAGDIDVEDAAATQLTARIDGSGDVRISGTVTEQDVEVRGAGDYSASALDSVDARVTVLGSGDASVSVSGSLDVRIDGSGQITYSGDPRVTKEISGSGELHRE